jgi:Holliday junction resolvasome RuvABC endonuclease subunit
VPKIKVMGLDGSLQNFGIAVGTVDTITKELLTVDNLLLSKTAKDGTVKRANDDFDRFRRHWETIETLIAAEKPMMIFGEIPSGSRDVRAAFAFGGVTSILAGLSLTNKLYTVTPAEVKLAASGWKHADKEDVIAAIHSRFPDADWIRSKKPNAMCIEKDGFYLTNANEHLADAVSTILAGLKKL